MRLVSKILPVIALAMACALPSYAQIGQGSMHGRVLDRDGKPLQDAQIVAEAIGTRFQGDTQGNVMARADGKTNKNGNYTMSGLYQGRYRVTVVIDGKGVMVHGVDPGDDIFVNDNSDVGVNFDLRKAPAAAPATPAAGPARAAGASGAAGDDSKAAASAAARKNAAETKAAFEAGKKAMEEKNYEEAVKQFQLASEKDPKQHVIFGNLGLAFSNLKKYDESVAAYKKAIELKPDEAPYFSNMSLVFADTGKLDEASEAASKAAQLSPTLGGQGYYNIGAILTNKGKTKEAVEMFKKAIEIDPKNANSYYQLGIAYFGQTETIPQAIPALETYLKLQPTGPNAEAAKNLIEAAKAQAPAEYKSDRAIQAEKSKNKGK
jgi:Flp pilus assembly protein TadD